MCGYSVLQNDEIVKHVQWPCSLEACQAYFTITERVSMPSKLYCNNIHLTIMFAHYVWSILVGEQNIPLIPEHCLASVNWNFKIEKRSNLNKFLYRNNFPYVL